MAFDGITIANLRWEFAHTIEGGKIAKIAQPEKRMKLLITIKNNRKLPAADLCKRKSSSYLSYCK